MLVTQIKASSNKEYGVDWPYFYTPSMENITKSLSQEIDFSKGNQIRLILTDFKIDYLSKEKQKAFLSMEFVKRSSLCRVRITGLHKTTNDGKFHPDIFKKSPNLFVITKFVFD